MMSAVPRPVPERRSAYRHFRPITTRWMDNDVYGHVNNVVYYAYFDTVVNGFLIAEGGLDFEHGEVVGSAESVHGEKYVVADGCQCPLKRMDSGRSGPLGSSTAERMRRVSSPRILAWGDHSR